MDATNTGTQTSHKSGNKPYKQLKVSVDPAIVLNFKDACTASNISMAAKLSEFMVDFSDTEVVRKPLPDYTTRRKRRAAIQAIIKQLEQIKDSEQQYQDRIPNSLQGSSVYERADEIISMIDEAIDLIAQI